MELTLPCLAPRHRSSSVWQNDLPQRAPPLSVILWVHQDPTAALLLPSPTLRAHNCCLNSQEIKKKSNKKPFNPHILPWKTPSLVLSYARALKPCIVTDWITLAPGGCSFSLICSDSWSGFNLLFWGQAGGLGSWNQMLAFHHTLRFTHPFLPSLLLTDFWQEGKETSFKQIHTPQW